MKNLYLLGATGSIGQQTIEIIRAHPDELSLKGVSGYNNFQQLKSIVDEFDLEIVAVKSLSQAEEIISIYPKLKVVYDEAGLAELAKNNPDENITLVNAFG